MTHRITSNHRAFLLAALSMTLWGASSSLLPATGSPVAKARRFEIQSPDFGQSPFTGATREHWMKCGRFMLEGAFAHVKGIDDPMLFPIVPGVSYPQKGYDKCSPAQRSAAIFEGVARTFNLASPLIAGNPDLTLNGIRLADYYKTQVLKLTDPACDYFIGRGDTNRGPQQQTCELGNLALWMLLQPQVLWDRLNREEQDQLADVMGSWAHGWTKTHNWRWFNVMMLTFLKHYGYAIDEDLLRNHLDHLLMLESGEGWFRDKGHDYYTAHVFQLYGAVWNKVYGWEHEPARAAVIDQQFQNFMSNYPAIFSREGKVNMWGRSIVYRMGGSAGLAAAFLRGRNPEIDPGFARRLASGSLLQFVTHPDFFQNGVPALGFYGHFEPAIQSYSCAASPFWMFMNYTLLTLPKDDPFWTAKEDEGFWAALGNDCRTTFLPGAGLLMVNDGMTGTSELINGKAHETNPSYFPAYCRLAYNTDFPWEANSRSGPTAAAISLRPHESEGDVEFPETIDLAGFRGGVLYRQAAFKVDSRGGVPCLVDMADIAVPGGKICIRRFRKISAATLYEGHFGLPHLGGAARILERTVDGRAVKIAQIPGRQLAITLYRGWDALATADRSGLNAEAEKSTLLYVSRTDSTRYGGPELLISSLLQKTDDSPWTDDALQPIRSVEPLRPSIPEVLGGVRVNMKSGRSYAVDFRGIDGSSSQ